MAWNQINPFSYFSPHAVLSLSLVSSPLFLVAPARRPWPVLRRRFAGVERPTGMLFHPLLLPLLLCEIEHPKPRCMLLVFESEYVTMYFTYKLRFSFRQKSMSCPGSGPDLRFDFFVAWWSAGTRLFPVIFQLNPYAPLLFDLPVNPSAAATLHDFFLCVLQGHTCLESVVDRKWWCRHSALLLCPVYICLCFLPVHTVLTRCPLGVMQVKIEDITEDGSADADARVPREVAVGLLPGSVHASLKEVMCSLIIRACRLWFLS